MGTQFFYLVAPLLLMLHLATVGCGSSASQDEDIRRTSYAAFQQADEEFQAKQYAAAEADFTTAIEEGGLNFDVHCEAHIKRAVCRAAAGRHAEALAELKEVADHGGDLAAVEAARSYVYLTQGNQAAARAALARARRLNPLVEVFRD